MPYNIPLPEIMKVQSKYLWIGRTKKFYNLEV
jgi:hypothetical protein